MCSVPEHYMYSPASRRVGAGMALLMDGIECLSRRHSKRVRLVLGVPHATECPIYVFWRYALSPRSFLGLCLRFCHFRRLHCCICTQSLERTSTAPLCMQWAAPVGKHLAEKPLFNPVVCHCLRL